MPRHHESTPKTGEGEQSWIVQGRLLFFNRFGDPIPEAPHSGPSSTFGQSGTCAQKQSSLGQPTCSVRDSAPFAKRVVNLRVYDLGEHREGLLSNRPRIVGCGWDERKQAPKREKQEQQERQQAPLESGLREELRAASEEKPDWEQVVRREANRLRGQHRARTQIRRLLLRYHLTTMWTLTFGENVQDLGVALQELGKFIRRVKYRVPAWQYIVVPERQKRGAWHFHIATNITWGHGELSKLWMAGFCWVKWAKNGGRRGMVAYMSKYLGKTLETSGEGNHRYYRSHNMELPYHEEMVSPGQPEALQEALERDGFKLSAELVPIVIDGLPWGWFSASMREDQEREEDQAAQRTPISPG